MRFHDRISAGAALIAPIQRVLGPDSDAVVLGLPRGGVVVAAPVADALHLPLDVLVVRKLGVPQQPEVAMGAIARGQVLLDWDTIRAEGIPDAAVEQVIAREQRELARRERLYRHGNSEVPLADRTVILVDDGIATGATVLSAILAVRTANPARIILATPVASGEAIAMLRPEVDEIVCLTTPTSFLGVGQWYRNFSQETDAEVIRLLQQSKQRRITIRPAFRTGGVHAE